MKHTAYPLKDQTGETVARVVAEKFIARFGCPLEIHTDQGRNFEGVFFKELCKIMDINKTRTTSYRPSANGQVERLNRSIAQIIRCCVHGKQERGMNLWHWLLVQLEQCQLTEVPGLLQIG